MDADVMTKHNAEEFDHVYRENYNEVFRYCRRLSRSSSRAEDLVQETFLKAFRNFSKYRQQRDIRNWLMRIATNTYLDLLRKERRRPTLLDESWLPSQEGLNGFSAPGRSASAILESTERLDAIERELTRLDRESEELIRMAYFAEVPYDEIGSRLGVSAQTVRSRLFRIRERMKEHLEETRVELLTPSLN